MQFQLVYILETVGRRRQLDFFVLASLNHEVVQGSYVTVKYI